MPNEVFELARNRVAIQRQACVRLLAFSQFLVKPLAQLGAERVARYLGCTDLEITGAHDISHQLGGTTFKEEAGTVFSRFLDYLRYVELEGSVEPMPEMSWFLTG